MTNAYKCEMCKQYMDGKHYGSLNNDNTGFILELCEGCYDTMRILMDHYSDKKIPN